MEFKKFLVKSRGIAVYEDKLLVVRHLKSPDVCVLPGGHVEFGEDVKESLEREMFEELGVVAQIDRLLYINNYVEGETHFIEFFFEVTNGIDYLDTTKLIGTHSFELAEICWMEKGSAYNLIPKQLKDYLEDGSLVSDTVRFI